MSNEFIKVGKLQGFEQINAKLVRLRGLGIVPKHESKFKILRAGGKVIKDEAISRAPERKSEIWHGRSKKALMLFAVWNKNIKSPVSRTRLGKDLVPLKESIGAKFAAGASRDNLTLRVLSRKPTGHLIEFGHKTRQGTGKAKGYKPKEGGKGTLPAQPFMQPSIDAKTDEAITRMGEVFDSELTKLINTTI